MDDATRARQRAVMEAYWADAQACLDEGDTEGAGYAGRWAQQATQRLLGADQEGDYVLNLAPVRLEAGERALVLDEARRQGFGTEYDNAAYPAISLTIAKRSCDVVYDDVVRAIALLRSVDPYADLQYVCFPYPYARGEFREIFTGPLENFARGVAS